MFRNLENIKSWRYSPFNAVIIFQKLSTAFEFFSTDFLNIHDHVEQTILQHNSMSAVMLKILYGGGLNPSRIDYLHLFTYQPACSSKASGTKLTKL